MNGPQMEIRRYYPGQPTTGVLYGEALGIGWMSSQETIDAGHRHYIPEGWNKLWIVANGPRIQTWVNGQMIEDLVDEEEYKTHKSSSIGLQVHGIDENDIARPVHAGRGITTSQPLIVKWRNIRVRPLARDDRTRPADGTPRVACWHAGWSSRRQTVLMMVASRDDHIYLNETLLIVPLGGNRSRQLDRSLAGSPRRISFAAPTKSQRSHRPRTGVPNRNRPN